MLSGLLAAAMVFAGCSTSEEQPAPSTVAERTTVAATAVATTTAPSTTSEPTTPEPPTTTSPEITVEFTLTADLAHQYPTPTPAAPTTVFTGCPSPDCFAPLTWSGEWQVASGAFSGPITHSWYIVGLGGVFEIIGLLWFEGTVAGCGTGGVAVREAMRHEPDGSASMGWEVVPGLGVGDLGTLNGHGTMSGFPTGSLTGTIRCQGGADPVVFSSTLLGTPAESGIDVAVPAHSPRSFTDYQIEPHPAQTDTPEMWVSDVDYDKWSTTMLNLGVRFPETSTTPVRNTMVSIFYADEPSVLFPDLDCQPYRVIGRTFLDDVLYPEFRGAWDLFWGAQGGGTYNATTNEGSVRCL